ncbi:TetR/AcrR family transcriptional regulator [Pseudodesulfovibrio sp.]|uniref:TetR/AcrR family transcriptional regulator n=1 Tax=Pseudodesulfovibrio sp. TaxID=2035812 RepID=UPI0026184FEA|nr:TetR/AcrR family transcriptional regulator [Pseudodesulfovibrio sp.]MDD3313037.1 TetR/AcrR family transcriptional regulator [Pseudodesulfovibrio sp.]
MAGAETRPRRGRPKAMADDERRALIAVEAEKLFVSQGFKGTSTDQIAAACRISKQTLYRLYPGKQELFAAVVESHRVRMIDLGDGYDDLPMDQALARIFMIDLDESAYERRAGFLRAAGVDSAQYPQLREILRIHGGEKNRADLRAWLDRQCRNGRLAVEDTDSAAHMLMDMLTGAVIFDAMGGFGWAGREERVAHFRRCIDIFLRGALPA